MNKYKVFPCIAVAALVFFVAASCSYAEDRVISFKAIASNKVLVFAPQMINGTSKITLRDICMFVDIGDKVEENTRLLSYRVPTEILLASLQVGSQKIGAIVDYYTTVRSIESAAQSSRNDFVLLQHPQSSLFYTQHESKWIADRKKLFDGAVSTSQSILGDLYEDLSEAKRSQKEYFRVNTFNFTKMPKTGYLTAPSSGRVLYIDPRVKNGATVLSSDPIMILGNLDPITLASAVYQGDIGKFSVGMKVSVCFDSNPSVMHEAQVVSILSQNSLGNMELPSVFELYLEIKNPDLAIKDGMRGHVVLSN